MHTRFRRLMTFILALLLIVAVRNGVLRAEERVSPSPESPHPLAAVLGLHFVEGSSSTLIVERDGKQYLVDLTTRAITENDAPVQVASLDPQQNLQTSGASGAAIFQQQCAGCHGADGKGGGAADLTDPARSGVPVQRIIDVITTGKQGTAMPAFSSRLSAADIRSVAAFVQTLPAVGNPNIFRATDDFLYSMPTGRRVARGEFDVNFTHRFAYNPAFSGPGLGNSLLGLDGFSVSAFGFRYGVTDRLSFSAYRAPSIIGRTIELMAAFNFMDENDNQPFNAAFRVSVDGQDHLRKNFTTNFEGVFSRSITNRAQFYAAPTLSLQNRRLLSKPGTIESRPANLPGINSFSLGGGLAVNIRPTVSLIAEAIPTLVNADDLGIHRPAWGFGVQKRVNRHTFTLGFSNSPGTTVAQRAGTRATYLGSPSADTPSGLTIGFNLMRRLR